MVTLDKIREDMAELLKVDSALHTVEVNADSMDEALSDAAVQLDTKPSNLEYEILEKGSDGFMGIGKKPWRVRIYQNPATIRVSSAEGGIDSEGEAAAEEAKHEYRDGLYYVRHFDSDIMLKVLLPIGGGADVDFKEVMLSLSLPTTSSIDEPLVKKLVKEGSSEEYQKVGEYNHVQSGDASVVIDVAKDEMSATVTATEPSSGGADVSASMIENALKVQGVTVGIDEAKISEFVDNPVYNAPYVVAVGIEPVNGNDAYVKYEFEPDVKKIHAKESATGQVDFKELNLIQNVAAGQKLAQKIPAERGKGGKTLFGRYLEATNGKDIKVEVGSNVHFDSDGLTMLSDIAGQVLLINNRVTVEPVLTLDKGVNIKTGNIKFVGSVIIKGNVDDGFDVEASGNIDVSGTVGKSRIKAGGNIVVQSGIFGRDEGYVTCDKSLWAKFIQATKVEVEENIFVTDSIMNSDVVAMKNIVLNGKKAQITGGELMATEEICAKNIGSAGGTETVLRVGFDPRAKKRLDELQEKQTGMVKELESVEMDIATLENQKQIRRTLPQEKEENLMRLKERQLDINDEMTKMSEEITQLQDRLRELKSVGKVKASGTVFGGTKIFVRDAKEELHNEIKAATFYYEDTIVKVGKYEPPKVEVKGPEGYS